jgi:hypothetical protein
LHFGSEPEGHVWCRHPGGASTTHAQPNSSLSESGTLRTPVGVLHIDELAAIEPPSAPPHR